MVGDGRLASFRKSCFMRNLGGESPCVLWHLWNCLPFVVQVWSVKGKCRSGEGGCFFIMEVPRRQRVDNAARQFWLVRHYTSLRPYEIDISSIKWRIFSNCKGYNGIVLILSVIWELREGDIAIYIHAQVDYTIPKGYLEHHIVAQAMDNLITRQEIDLS